MGLKARMIWHFTPSDFLEDTFRDNYEGVKITIEDGRVIAEMERATYEARPELAETLRRYIESLFEGVRLQSHNDFEIRGGVVEMDRENGARDVVVRVGTAVARGVGGEVDINVRDAEGNVVVDTQRDRIESKWRFARLVASKRGTDETFDAMIESYSHAVKDPENELVHLYEVRDALVSRFGNSQRAMNALGISKSKWSMLGRLANDEPLKQGRHRGKTRSDHRDATKEELTRARSIAREMIERYASWIES